MKTVVLDGLQMVTKSETHDYLKEVLGLSDHYGANLDALWDELSCYSQALSIELIHLDAMEASLGDYAVKLKEVFHEIGMFNKGIMVKFESENDF